MHCANRSDSIAEFKSTDIPLPLSDGRPKVTAVILDYNKGERVIENVRGLLGQKVDFELEVIVADNSCNARNAQILAPLGQLDGVSLFIN